MTTLTTRLTEATEPTREFYPPMTMNPDPLEVWRTAWGTFVDATDDWDEANQAAAAIIAQHYEPLLAEVERLRGDAARYHWLRDESCPPHNFYVSVPDEFKGVRYSAHEVDTYIDAARQALGEKS